MPLSRLRDCGRQRVDEVERDCCAQMTGHALAPVENAVWERLEGEELGVRASDDRRRVELVRSALYCMEWQLGLAVCVLEKPLHRVRPGSELEKCVGLEHRGCGRQAADVDAKARDVGKEQRVRDERRIRSNENGRCASSTRERPGRLRFMDAATSLW